MILKTRYTVSAKSMEKIFSNEKTKSKPEYQINCEKIIKILKKKKSGYTLGEIYKEAYPMFDRRVREAVYRLKSSKEITAEKCRCGAGTIYKIK